MLRDRYQILSINPGSTSTKLAVFGNDTLLFEKKVSHPVDSLAGFKRMADQLQMRYEAVIDCLRDERFDLATLDAVACRGGKLPPLRQGAYRVDDRMVDFLAHRPIDDHASNLGALIGHRIAQAAEIPAYIYDAVVVDELEPIARLSGMPDIQRRASCHVLNMRAVALKTAQELGRPLERLNLVTCHLGGGVSAAAMQGGRMIDVLTDEEGAYSPERAGGVPCRQLVNLCFAGKYTQHAVNRRLRGEGGLVAYLGTNSALEVEDMIRRGDERAALVYRGIAYQTAKGIAGLASVLAGKVDAIVLTGALAHSEMMMNCLVERISFIAPVRIWPGEDELQALALGILRVLRGEETAFEFADPDQRTPPRPA
jgi:butyrate kinase